MQYYTQKFFGAWGFLLIDEKKVFSQALPCKKNSCEICHIFFQIIILSFFFNSDCCCFYTKNLKIYEDLYCFFFVDLM